MNAIKTLVIVVGPGKLYQDIGSCLKSAFSAYADRISLIEQPGELPTNPDAILFVCDFTLVELFEPALARLCVRPAMGWWYLEPLPPAELYDEASRSGNILEKCHGILRKPGCKPKMKWWNRLPGKICSAKLEKRLSQKGYSCDNLDDKDLFWMAFRLSRIASLVRKYRIDHLFTTTPSRQKILSRCCPSVHLVPMGYHRIWGTCLDRNKDIDVTFLGHIRKKNGKRGKIVRLVRDALQQHNKKMEIVTKGCFGEDRERLLNRTKILLDVVRMPWELPGMRMLIAGVSKAAVVTCGFDGDSTPYQKNTHFVTATKTSLVETILNYLQDEPQRKKIAENMYRFVTQDNTIERSAEMIMKCLQNSK